MEPGLRPRVFLDSNVVFSGLYSSGGPVGVILEHFINGKLAVVISRRVLDEVVLTLKEKLPGAIPVLERLLVTAPPEIVRDPGPEAPAGWARLLHPEDAAIAAAAVAARPDYFVTGDKHFLDNAEVAEEMRLCIVTPAQFLDHFDRPEQV